MKQRETTDADVLVFKTSLKYKKDVKAISPYLSKHEHIRKWNVAIDDCDRVLRIEAVSQINKSNLAETISKQLNLAGFDCEELN